SDFGLARQTDGSGGRTASGLILGSPSYMAPEQAAGRKKDIGPATDVYALGVMLYEMLTGKPPFRGDTMLETLDRVRQQPPERPSTLRPGLPADLEALCLHCLHKDPAGRPASALQLAEELRRGLEQVPPSTVTLSSA